ncbi:MAG: hypothetical protein ACTH6N_13740 [Brachybacterium tyrofermentans]|uniref:hypothetical protein n=1 Tax=Brachybacterium tyrofermentans TaxID=47848 RepID=UPI0018688084|nr:hypothetical protein [Brachybacterium tyrofermentans]
MKALLLERGFPIVAGVLAVAAAVVLATRGDWEAATWAVIASAAWFLHVIHQCPVAAPVEGGEVTINFDGGPHDGGWTMLPTADLPEMLGKEIHADDATYTVTAVEHTCYTAEVTR